MNSNRKEKIPKKTVENAEKYLKKRRIKELFDVLMSQVLANQPEEPLYYLMELLDKYMLARADLCKPIILFSALNIHHVFKCFDTGNTGFITTNQYKTAMASLGIINPNIPITEDGNITLEIFEKEALDCWYRYLSVLINAK